MNEAANFCIYDFSDHVSFLKTFFSHKKLHNKNFSYGVWSRDLGLANTASLTRIVNEDRIPSDKTIHAFEKYFKFNANQCDFFRYLVLLKKTTKDPQLKTLVLEKLKSLHPRKNFKLLDDEVFSCVSEWYYFVIREMVNLKDFVEDEQYIIKKLHFPIKKKQIKEAIETLLKLNLLKRNSKGILEQTENHIDWKDDIASEASKRNHEANLENAKVALRNIQLEQREFNSVALNINLSDLPQIKESIRHFKRSFINQFERPINGEATSLLQIQFFPYTKTTPRRTNEY